MVTLTLVIGLWMVATIVCLIWDNARKHHQINELQQSIAILTHPFHQSWRCVCGHIHLQAVSEISDGKGMTHRAINRCIPDLEVVP